MGFRETWNMIGLFKDLVQARAAMEDQRGIEAHKAAIASAAQRYWKLRDKYHRSPEQIWLGFSDAAEKPGHATYAHGYIDHCCDRMSEIGELPFKIKSTDECNVPECALKLDYIMRVLVGEHHDFNELVPVQKVSSEPVSSSIELDQSESGHDTFESIASVMSDFWMLSTTPILLLTGLDRAARNISSSEHDNSALEAAEYVRDSEKLLLYFLGASDYLTQSANLSVSESMTFYVSAFLVDCLGCDMQTATEIAAATFDSTETPNGMELMKRGGESMKSWLADNDSAAPLSNLYPLL